MEEKSKTNLIMAIYNNQTFQKILKALNCHSEDDERLSCSIDQIDYEDEYFYIQNQLNSFEISYGNEDGDEETYGDELEYNDKTIEDLIKWCEWCFSEMNNPKNEKPLQTFYENLKLIND